MDPYTNFRRSGYGRSQLINSVPGRTVGIQCCMQPANQAENMSVRKTDPGFSSRSMHAGTYQSSSISGCPGVSAGHIENLPIGMGYVPMQQWQQIYNLEQGLTRGTIFPELDLPFVMGRCQ